MGVFGDASPLTIVGFILAGGSFVLQLIGFATPFWLYNAVGDSKAYSGLWQLCASNPIGTSCASWPCGGTLSKYIIGCTDATKGTQALEILAFLALLAAVVIIFIKLCVLKDQAILTVVGVVCCFVAAGFAMIGVIVYGSQKGVPSENLHFSFAFCILAAIGSIIAGLLILVGRRTNLQ